MAIGWLVDLDQMTNGECALGYNPMDHEDSTRRLHQSTKKLIKCTF